MNMLKTLLRWTSWPGLLVIALSITAWGFAIDRPVLVFNLTYLAMVVTLLGLERFIPYEQKWMQGDGQTLVNLAHTIMSKGVVQALILFGGIIGLTHYITPMAEVGYGIWPRHWPLWVQVPMGLIVAEFMLYWAHRVAHEVPVIWKFHAVHHSVKALWVINTGRFHFVDSLISIVLGMSILLALGAPLEIITWLSAVTAFIGLLTHCNVDMQCGWLNYVFNTPQLHRWHHSKKRIEGNSNYGENFMVWDQLFRSFIYPKGVRPPTNIGITEKDMPDRFWAQVVWPFKKIFS